MSYLGLGYLVIARVFPNNNGSLKVIHYIYKRILVFYWMTLCYMF